MKSRDSIDLVGIVEAKEQQKKSELTTDAIYDSVKKAYTCMDICSHYNLEDFIV